MVNMDPRKMSDVMASLVEGGAKVVFDIPANKVTITRQPQTGKVTKDVNEKPVIGVEVTAYAGSAEAAATDAVNQFFATCEAIDNKLESVEE